MRRWLCLSAVIVLLIGGSVITLVSLGSARPSLAARQSKSPRTITVTPWGPDQRTIDDAKSRLLKNPAVTAPIIGPRTLAQLDEALGSLELDLDDETMKKLDELWPGPGDEAPEAYAW